MTIRPQNAVASLLEAFARSHFKEPFAFSEGVTLKKRRIFLKVNIVLRPQNAVTSLKSLLFDPYKLRAVLYYIMNHSLKMVFVPDNPVERLALPYLAIRPKSFVDFFCCEVLDIIYGI